MEKTPDSKVSSETRENSGSYEKNDKTVEEYKKILEEILKYAQEKGDQKLMEKVFGALKGSSVTQQTDRKEEDQFKGSALSDLGLNTNNDKDFTSFFIGRAAELVEDNFEQESLDQKHRLARRLRVIVDKYLEVNQIILTDENQAEEAIIRCLEILKKEEKDQSYKRYIK